MLQLYFSEPRMKNCVMLTCLKQTEYVATNGAGKKILQVFQLFWNSLWVEARMIDMSDVS